MTDTRKDRVVIFDTTLRDGEQCPGATMTTDEKIQVAKALDSLGVDVMEAGFPAASPGDFEAVVEIGKVVDRAIVCGLARANVNDIDRAGEAVRHAKRGRIHTFIATSPLHMTRKLNMQPHEVIEKITWSVTRARNLIDDVEWSAEDATQSDREFLARCIEAAIRAGASTINIPDTCGYTEPEEYGELIRYLISHVPGAEATRFSTHCHDDLGMAVANSLSGIRAGARQIECTMNAIGERAGNAALEEVVMAIKTRGDRFPFETGIDTTQLTRVSKLVSAVTSFPVQYNKAIVGRNAFAHESGIHQDGMIKHARMYEIMTPESVGAKQTSLVLGKHSGRAAFKRKVEELGYSLGENEIEDAFARFKVLCDRVKHVTDEDIEAIVDEKIATATDTIRLISMTAIGSTEAQHSATVKLKIGDLEVLAAGEGNGPVNAIFDAIKKHVMIDAVKLEDYQVRMIQGSAEGSQAETLVQISCNGRSVTAKAADPDTLVSAGKAYVGALNKLLKRSGRSIHSTDIAAK